MGKKNATPLQVLSSPFQKNLNKLEKIALRMLGHREKNDILIENFKKNQIVRNTISKFMSAFDHTWI